MTILMPYEFHFEVRDKLAFAQEVWRQESDRSITACASTIRVTSVSAPETQFYVGGRK
jgi:hypothetical protein